MDKIRIFGGRPLEGTINIGGSKNAALPLMAASLLTTEKLTLNNLPHLTDVITMVNLLGELGVGLTMDGIAPNGGNAGRTVTLVSNEPNIKTAPYELVRRMRASVLVLGPLLSRWGEAQVSLPGGCAIGTRPVDLHIKAFETMGAKIELREGYINASAPNGLKGANIIFPSVSVGATENVLMAATLADGITKISNAAREPEVADLANCLVAMGANIDGIGTDTLKVKGVKKMRGASYEVIPDRIEIGTYAVAAAITGGNIFLKSAQLKYLSAVAELLRQAGADISEETGGVRVQADRERVRGTDVITEPYPGFPTDMQAQIMALLVLADGASMITESIFENRFMHVPELCRMGADINVHGSSAIIRGVRELSGAQLMATDLRASVSLILAGLAAKGETTINRVYHLDRGYERLEEKLAGCGAKIERFDDT
ncbi:MAG: UDP-N-acetylglucosamine 1-carboxyvinyltransferase [Pseudomonadota bacterium]|nr:UDP-N-acetylglucosamine 1-carboxyvinyltransferase [Pseudomonadota bacterium]